MFDEKKVALKISGVIGFIIMIPVCPFIFLFYFIRYLFRPIIRRIKNRIFIFLGRKIINQVKSNMQEHHLNKARTGRHIH